MGLHRDGAAGREQVRQSGAGGSLSWATACSYWNGMTSGRSNDSIRCITIRMGSTLSRQAWE